MKLPRIKPAQEPKRRGDGAIWIGHGMYGLATELVEESGVLWTICQLMDGTRSMPELIAEVTAAHPGTTDVEEMIDFLIESGWVHDMDPPVPAELGARDLDRYSRGIQFLSTVNTDPAITGLDLQARLKASRVVVLGLGGVGSASAMSLAASGVGQLHCVDHDTVELSNLNRQLLYTEEAIGKRKADVAVDRLRALNTDITVTGEDLLLDGPEAVSKAVGHCDAIVLCADDPPEDIRLWTNQVAFAERIPMLLAGYAGPKFSTECFIPGQTTCYACHLAFAFERQNYQGIDNEVVPYLGTGLQPVIAPVAQIAGHYLALETIRLLTGLGVLTAGRELTRFVLDYELFHYIATEPRPDCPVGCGAMRPK
jgi:molybdopterin/thiamine biosynthesis adenylyltransferase